jgi:hypothetical protein
MEYEMNLLCLASAISQGITSADGTRPLKPPKCKLCEKAHWPYEEHDTLEEVQKLGVSVLRNQAPTVTKPSDENVTSSTVRISPEQMECDLAAGRLTHGGPREGSGRIRQHKTNAERQAAYRERKGELE